MHRLCEGGRPAAIAAIVSLAIFFSVGSGWAASPRDVASAGTDLSATPGNAPEIAAARSAIPVDCPIGLAINSHDELFVANHWAANTFCATPGQILVFDKDGTQLTDRTIKAGIINPAGLAFDAKGNLYESDYAKQEVRVYDPAGKLIPGKLLHTDKNYNPSGVQIDGKGDVWVANRTNGNITLGEIEIFRKGGGVDKISSGVVYPVGIVFQAKTGNAWVANSETPNGNSFSIFSQGGRFLEQIPTPGFTPTYMAFYTKNGRLYATDGILGANQLRIFDPSGRQIGNPITAGLNLPYGIAFNSAGDFFVANVGAGTSTTTITKYSPSGKLLCTITTSGCKK